MDGISCELTCSANPAWPGVFEEKKAPFFYSNLCPGRDIKPVNHDCEVKRLTTLLRREKKQPLRTFYEVSVSTH